MDGEGRTKGERNVQLVNEKASFTDEGHKITLVTYFSNDKIVIEPQGTPEDTEANYGDSANSEVRVRRTLQASDKTTKEISEDTKLSNDYLRNKVLPPMRTAKAVFKVGTKGR